MTQTIEVVTAPQDLRRWVRKWKQEGQTVALVPTMGALHEGHLSLVRLARKHADRVVVSIFVNPAQFGADEDLALYPRQSDEDATLLAGDGCDLVFLPDVETIYPPGHSVFVDLDESTSALDGDCEPGQQALWFQGDDRRASGSLRDLTLYAQAAGSAATVG